LMEKKFDQGLTYNIKDLKELSAGKSFLPPWIFQHGDLIDTLESAQPLKQEKLINKINYINFMDGHVFVLLRHPKYDEGVFAKAYPEICLGSELTCLWDKCYAGFNLQNYCFQYMIVVEDQTIILVPATLIAANNERFTIQLPEKGYPLSKRRIIRFACQNVAAELMQRGFFAKGEVMDFSPVTFRMKVHSEKPSSYHYFNPDVLSAIRLTSNDKILFSGNCHCIRQNHDFLSWEIVLAPPNEHVNRFQTRKIRHPRREIFPSPIASFEHPFFKRKIQREISNISITGFSVNDEADSGVLMPGMIIHDLSIVYAGELKMSCTAQVIYRRTENENKIFCGIAILDMDIHSYSRLNRILSLNMDPHAHISTEVDMDALWEFFFDTGFIYPKKYKLFQHHREEFKNTYKKIYQENPEIAMHLTYERNGRIYGHMSMIRAYERGWMIHHHAARRMEKKRPGLLVLKQMMLFLYGMYHLPSVKMDYIICYFRPENEFPNLIFGGFARDMNNQQICSLDLFSYVTFPVGVPQNQLPHGWVLNESTNIELWELEQFYKHSSGGLLLNVLDLPRKDFADESLEDVARRLGFVRKWKAYSLANNGCLKAFLIVNQSDVGVNLSELLNGIKAIVVDPEGLPWELLYIAVANLTGVYQLENIPLLIYPSSYTESKNISYEKNYHLWILNALHHPNEFVEYMQKNFGINYE
jgi:hypothetical protein